MSSIRSPICVVVGHVDHGKSSVLDYIRSTNIVASEAGSITQAIGASIIPIETIKEKCGQLATQMNLNFTIPGLLFIDTPGHAAFSSLRKRGGALADIAIVVVNINEGFKPQTIESIKILKESKTPFVVAANKIDLIKGYKSQKTLSSASLLGNIGKQQADVQQLIETKMYELVGQFHELGFQSERFDRVGDFTKEIALVPTSAKIGDGMSELLMVLSAIVQKFLEQGLEFSIDGPAKGTVLEVKEVQGMGTALDVIIYDGSIKINDIIVIGDINSPIVTKVRGLFVPNSLTDMRDKKAKYKSIKVAYAATGVRVCAPQLDRVISGMPIAVATQDTVRQIEEDMKKELSDMSIKLDDKGIIVKADTIGSLEAMVSLLRDEDISIRMAEVGEISKRDLLELESNFHTDESSAVLLGFNIKQPQGKYIGKIITDSVIYKIIEEFMEYKKSQEDKERQSTLERLPRVGKCQFLEGCAFRQNNPAVFGVEVLSGVIHVNMLLMKSDGSRVDQVKALQENKADVKEATAGMKVACSMQNVTITRQVNEGDTYYTQISESDFLKLKEHKDLISEQQKEVLKEIAVIQRKQNPGWGLE